MTLSRDAILGASDIVTEPVSCPEWISEPILVKGMTGAERDAFEAMIRKGGELDLRNARARLLVRVIVNESGTRIFTDADAAELGKKSARVINRLYDVAAKLSGLADEDVEELEGNSEAGQTGDLSSTSLGSSAALSQSY
jgi:hypothetical protein